MKKILLQLVSNGNRVCRLSIVIYQRGLKKRCLVYYQLIWNRPLQHATKGSTPSGTNFYLWWLTLSALYFLPTQCHNPCLFLCRWYMICLRCEHLWGRFCLKYFNLCEFCSQYSFQHLSLHTMPVVPELGCASDAPNWYLAPICRYVPW